MTRNVDIDRNEVDQSWQLVKKAKGGPGVDGVSLMDYENNLDNLNYKVWNRLSSGSYQSSDVLLVDIPKVGGGHRTLGIPTVIDRVAQQVIKRRLEPILEPHFKNSSYGYRPGREQKGAIEEVMKQGFRRHWAIDLDIKSFFDNIDHEWMLRMLEERINDRAFIRLIRKWLKAGVLEDIHTVIHPGAGTPQGGVISPILANIYLHYALDLWFERSVKKRARGECMLVRYADDFVCAFRYKSDAKRFYREQLPQRLAKFSLELAPEKTNMIRFSRFEYQNGRSFEFLGFEFRWGLNRHKRPQVKRRTARKKQRAACEAIQKWVKGNRNEGLRPIMATLKKKLYGHWNYYGVHHNSKSLWDYYYHTCYVVLKWLNRRSQRRSFTWVRFLAMLERYGIPKPRITEKPAKRRYSNV